MAVDSDHDESVRRIARRMRGIFLAGRKEGILSCTYVITFAACLPACSMSRRQAGRQGIFILQYYLNQIFISSGMS